MKTPKLKLLTTKDVARLVRTRNLCPDDVIAHAHKGLIVGIKVKGKRHSWRFELEEVNRYERRLAT
jgi:hypothetical protein